MHCGETPWRGLSSWSDDTLHRDVFFVDVCGTAVYASLYAPRSGVRVDSRRHLPIVGDRGGPRQRARPRASTRDCQARRRRRIPGYLGMATAAASAANDDVRRSRGSCLRLRRGTVEHRGTRRDLVGIRLGAAVAVRAAEHLGARGLLLIQPALDVPTYFHDLARRSRRGTLGVAGVEGFAFGYPLPHSSGTNGAGEDASALTGMLPGRRPSSAIQSRRSSNRCPRWWRTSSSPVPGGSAIWAAS